MTVDELIDGWEAAWSGKDPAAFAELCVAGRALRGPAHRRAARGRRRARPPRRAPVGGVPRRPARAHRRASVQRPLRGRPRKLLATHRAALEGLPATNRFIVVHCVFYCELERERLLRVRAFFDLYDAATQLGVLPGRGTLGEKALLVLRGFGLRGGVGRGPGGRTRWQESSGAWHCGQRRARAMIAACLQPAASSSSPFPMFRPWMSPVRQRCSRRRDRAATAPAYDARARRRRPGPIRTSSGLAARRPDAPLAACRGAIDTLVVAGGRGVREAARERAD